MYILVEVIERDTVVTKHETLEEAQEVMKNHLCEALNVDNLDEADENDEEYELHSTSAWANTNHPGNCDWTIFNLNEI